MSISSPAGTLGLIDAAFIAIVGSTLYSKYSIIREDIDILTKKCADLEKENAFLKKENTEKMRTINLLEQKIAIIANHIKLVFVDPSENLNSKNMRQFKTRAEKQSNICDNIKTEEKQDCDNKLPNTGESPTPSNDKSSDNSSNPDSSNNQTEESVDDFLDSIFED